jgi:hypothetical protein
LVLRVASLLWRRRRATSMETGLFEIQADHLSALRKEGPFHSASRQIVYAMSGQPNSVGANNESSLSVRSGETDTSPCRDPRFAGLSGNPSVDLAHFASRQSVQLCARSSQRYETTLWRQVGQTLFALGALDRRKPQEQGGRFRDGKRQKSLTCAHDEE